MPYTYDHKLLRFRLSISAVLVLVGLVFVADNPNALASYGFGGLLLAGGIAAYPRAKR